VVNKIRIIFKPKILFITMRTHTHIYIYTYYITEGSLEVKLPTIWTDEKQRWGRGGEKSRVEERR